MRLRSYQTWKLRYLFVSPEQWARDHETHFWLKEYGLIVSGLQSRLAALGYGACDAPGVFGAGTKQALHAFQQAEMSEEACTGEADSATRSKLVAVYGV